MASFARRLVTGLVIVGVAYALDPKRDLLRRGLKDGQIDRWREQLEPRLKQLREEYGPTLRKLAVAAGFMPGLKLRWRVLAAAMPRIASALQTAATPPATRPPTA